MSSQRFSQSCGNIRGIMRPRTRIFYGWVVVATAAVGLLFGAFPIVVASFPIFFESYVHDFHARRGTISAAFTIHNFIAAFLSGWIGRLADRLGVRRVVLYGQGILGLILVSAGITGSSIWQLYVFYSALGVVSGATTAVPYALVVSRWFNRRRGLALGLMMIGAGAGSILMPPVTQRLIAGYGWRAAFVMIGCAIWILPVPVIGSFLEETPDRMGLVPDGTLDSAISSSQPEGLTWREIRKDRTFWRMIAAFLLAAASVHACFIHLPQLLADRGASLPAAALATSGFGLAVMAGRIATGVLLDRYFGPSVALFLFGLAALGMALLAIGITGVPALLSAFLVGLAFGAEVDIVAYLMGRYFGLRSLGSAFGFGFGAYVMAGGLGPLIMGFAYDHTGSYRAPLSGFLIATIVAAELLGRLGPYRFAVSRKTQAAAEVRPG
jgi:MFS family permease